MSWYNKLQGRLDNESVTNDLIVDFNSYLESAPNAVNVQKNHIQDDIRVVLLDFSVTGKNANIKTMLSSLNNPFDVGDIVTWKNNDWIVFWRDEKTVEDNVKVKIEQCNNILKYYDEESNLHQIPCVIKKGVLFLDDNQYEDLSLDFNYAVCVNNEETSHIDMNTKFILNGDVFKVSGIDKITTNGILTIKINKDLKTSDDNFDKNIADYKKNIDLVDTSENNTISITPNISTVKLNKSITLTAHYVNNNVEDNSQHFTWNLSNSDGSNNVYASIVGNDKTAILTAGNIVNKDIIIKCELSNNSNKFIEQKIKIVSLF